MARIQELWDNIWGHPLAERIQTLAGHVKADPFVWGAVALATLLLVWMLVLLFRRKSAAPAGTGQYLSGEDFKQRRKVKRSIERTLQELQQDDPQFVNVMHSILKYRSVDQLLSHDEVEVAFGRLSYLQEKRRNVPKKRSSLLALAESSHDTKEKQAAMLTVVRSCYASDEIYCALDESGRRLIDRFLDSL